MPAATNTKPSGPKRRRPPSSTKPLPAGREPPGNKGGRARPTAATGAAYRLHCERFRPGSHACKAKRLRDLVRRGRIGEARALHAKYSPDFRAYFGPL